MRFSFLAMLVACGTSRAQFVNELAELQCEQSLTCDWDGEYCGDSYHDELEQEFGEANCAVWDAAAASACLELVRAAAEDSECEGDRVSCDGPCR